MVNFISLSIPTPDQCEAVRQGNTSNRNNASDNPADQTMDNDSHNAAVVPAVQEFYQITIIVQLLQDVPAMISMLLKVRMTMSLLELKCLLIEKLNEIGRTLSIEYVNFHFCALERFPAEGDTDLSLARTVMVPWMCQHINQ